MTSRSFLGLAAVSVMPLLGPRPLFVRTAYAEAPALIEPVAVQIVAAEPTSETLIAGEHVRVHLVVPDATD
jgi:hypothetical protein